MYQDYLPSATTLTWVKYSLASTASMLAACASASINADQTPKKQ